MNLRGVLRVLSLLLLVVASAQLIPLLVSLALDEGDATLGFALGSGATLAVSVLCRLVGGEVEHLFRREGVLIVVSAWVLASISGAIPYVASGAIPHFVDALFESASGFTTTGSSILTDIPALGHSMLFWRSMTQWLGGIGIVVLFVALLSELGPGARFLFKLEVPGPAAEVLHPRVNETAVTLAWVYIGLSGLQVAALLVCGLSLYDAFTHMFSTVSTGGFSPYPDSIAHFPPVVQAVVTVFMLAAGANFSLYYVAVRDRSFRPFRDPELRTYLLVVAVTIVFIMLDLGVGTESFLDAAFQVVSIVTTTGFATQDFVGWPVVSQACLVALMVVGGCAGSTAGGVKVVRLQVALRAAFRDVRLIFHPSRVAAISQGHQPVGEDAVRTILSFLVLYGLCWGIGALLLCVGEPDLETATTAAIASLSNVGPGLSVIGPTGDYHVFAAWQKLLMVGLMWLGRLELFVVLALLQPSFWRR